MPQDFSLPATRRTRCYRTVHLRLSTIPDSTDDNPGNVESIADTARLMSPETRAPGAEDPSTLPPHLLENFEKAERNIREIYGKSPPVSDLLRLWIATATSWEIQTEFERTVMNIRRTTAQPNKDGLFDEDSFDF